MAETVKIEIPVSVKDNTSAGIQSASRNMSGFEKSMKRTEQQLNRMDKAHHINVDTNDQASGKISRLSDAVDTLDGMNPDIEVSADDSASRILDGVASKASSLDGSSSDVDVGANDTATGVINGAEDALENFDGSSGSADIGANDTATSVIRSAEDAVENYDGTSASADIGANDTASPVIDSVKDKGESWGGSSYNATIGIVDNATAPLQGILNMLSNPLLQGAAILGVSLGAADTVGTYTDFTSMMSQVSAISGATGSELASLTAKAKEMGATTKFTAAESAEAFNYMAMAGWKTRDMTEGIGGILSLAAASGENLGTTSDIVTDALTAFGLKAESAGHFADVMAQASANANTNVSMLGESFKYVAPVAGAMNYTIEDTSLALGLMANSSIKGSMAGTSLKTALANMAAPTDNMKAAMDKYNLSLTDNNGHMKSLGQVIDEMRTNLGGLSETEQTAAASTIFGKEAMAGMLAIINASEDDYNKLSQAINNSSGAADKMADTMLDNLGGSITLLQSALDGVKISLGERVDPYLTDLAQWLTAQMPGVEAGLNQFMDFVDDKVSGAKAKIGSMTNSEEWKNADLLGKIDIAWDKIIAEPFMEWIGSSGKDMFSQGIGDLFSNAAGILPGGKKAGLTSWLSAGLIGMGGMKLFSEGKKIASALTPIGTAIKSIGSAASEADSIGGVFTSLTSLSSKAGMIGLAAAGITAAIVGIGVAIDNYNQKQISDSLEEHFGNIKLSAADTKEIAAGILNQKYLTNVELALNEVRNADSLREEAQKALESNDVLEFKSRVGITLTPEEKEEYTGNIETFVNSKIEELESRTFAAYIHVQTYLGGTEEGQTLEENIKTWARADNLELTELSNDLQTAVENALKDGIISVDEEEAISALQEKINNITSRWKAAEAKAQWDWINTEYGNLSAADLDSGSFTDLLGAMREQRGTAMESVRADVTAWYQELNAMESSGRITSDQNKMYQEMTGNYVRNQKGSEIAKSLTLGNNTLNDVYGNLVSTNLDRIASKGGGNAIQSLNEYAASGNFGSIIQDGLLYNDRNFYSLNGGADRKALNGLYEQMKPDVADMGSLIDSYREAGQKVPQSLMDSFNESIKIGAASGDSDAAWQLYANSIKESGNSALVSALTDPNNEWYSVLQDQLPEEFKTALQRAFSETTDEEYTLEGIKASVDGDVDVNKEEWLSKIQDSLGDLGTVEGEVDGDIKIQVEKGDCLSQIGDALGVDWHEIAAYNGLEDPYTIYPGMEIKIPEESVNVDASGVEGAVENSTEVDPIEAETTANITVVPGETDTTQLNEQLSAETTADPVETETTADTTVVAGETDTSQATAGVQGDIDDAFSTTMDTDGSTDVTIDQTNNSQAVYDEVCSELRGKFASVIPVSASAAVTISWSITNPNKSISFSGSGGGSVASVSASFNAAGGEVGVSGPELSWLGEEGLEYVIPTVPGRRQRGIELWEKAGRTLGVLGTNGEISAHANGGIVGAGSDLIPEDSIQFSKIPEKENDIVWGVTGQILSGDSEKGTSEGNDTGFSLNALPNNSESGDKNVEVNVNMNPVIKIDGSNMDKDQIFEVLQSRIREMADELGDEIAERISKIFGNMPTVQEA